MRAVPSPDRDRTLSTRGSLRTSPLAHLLVALLDHEQTGTLRLLEPTGTIHALVQFEEGLPVAVRTRSFGGSLAQSLIPLCACAEGDYVFVAGVDEVGVGEGAVVGRVDPVALINAAMRGPLREDIVEQTLAMLSDRLLRLHPRVKLARYKFTDVERQIVSALEEGPATLDQLIAQSGANPGVVRRLMYVLQITRGISPVPGPRAASGTIERVVPPASLPPSAASASSVPPPLPPSALRFQKTVLEVVPPRAAGNESADAAGRYHVVYNEGGPTDVVVQRPLSPWSQASQERQLEAEQHYREAQQLLRRSDYPAAMHSAHRAMRAYGTATNEALYAWLLYLTGDVDNVNPRALRHLQRALQREPDCVDAHFYMGVLCKKMGSEDEAFAHFRRVLRIKPGHQEAAREVRLREMRRKSQSTSGFLSKLFGRSER